MWLFHECSKYVFDWIKNQNHVKEESLTDWILYDISQKCASIYYQAFTRHEEAQNGSDWEWWVLVPDSKGIYKFNAYRFVVQAKKLLPKNKDNYPVLTYGNKYGTQIDLLMDFAKSRNALPLYMFYSIGESDIAEQIKNVYYLSEQNIRWCENCINGCFLMLASNVYDLIYNTARKKILDYQLLNHSFKLSLLDIGFRCTGVEVDEILNGFNDSLVRRTLSQDIRHHNDTFEIKHSEKTIPKYLKVFINERHGELSWFEEEMKITDIDGLGVIDLRDR